MTKLHELLAVEPGLVSKTQQALNTAKKLFGNAGLFAGQSRTYRPFDDAGQQLPDESKELQRTVDGELTDVFAAFGNLLDVSIQKEVTNQQTSARIVIDDIVLADKLPTPALLNIESKLVQLRDALDTIPTLPLDKKWEWNKDSDSWVSEPQTSYRTEKSIKSHVAYEATDKHPAQVHLLNIDKNIGAWKTVHKSAAMRPVDKREMLARLDKVLRATKKAIRRANDIEIELVDISPVLTYIWE